MKLSKAFTVKGEINRVFDSIQAFMPSMKFRLENANRPILLVFKRGSKLGSLVSFEVEGCETILTISLQQNGDEVNILCSYDVLGIGQVFTSSDRSTLESEIERLQYFLKTSI
ncbi:MAG: hypothetical protein QW304_08965 [Thermoproteota archaeon]